MNTPTPYEQLIAGKLDQVPVPDMADSVWASIVMQLDADGPDQGNDAADRKASPKFKGKGWFGFWGVVVVVVITLWYYNHKVVPMIRPPAPAAAPAPAVDSNRRIDSVRKTNIPAAPIGVGKDTVLLNKVPYVTPRVDSASQLVLPSLKIDSSSLHREWVPFPFFDSLSVKPRGRKPRGVKGITDEDYKISAEKSHN